MGGRGDALQGCLTYSSERIIRKRQREPNKSLFARVSLVPIPVRVLVYSARRHLLRGGFRVSSWPRLPLRRKLVREAAEGSQRVISEWQARDVIKGGLLWRCRPLLAESRFCFCRRRCHPGDFNHRLRPIWCREVRLVAGCDSRDRATANSTKMTVQ